MHAEYDICLKNWFFNASTNSIKIYEFDIASAEALFKRIHYNDTAATYEDIVVLGYAHISGLNASVIYNASQPIFTADLSYASSLVYGVMDVIYIPGVNCSAEDTDGIFVQ